MFKDQRNRASLSRMMRRGIGNKSPFPQVADILMVSAGRPYAGELHDFFSGYAKVIRSAFCSDDPQSRAYADM
jgi:hypothetical protein